MTRYSASMNYEDEHCQHCGTADHCESYDEDCRRSMAAHNGNPDYGYGDCDDERCTCEPTDIEIDDA